MRPGDRLVCAFVQAAPARPFKQWPLHVTIVPWFRNGIESKNLTTEIQTILADVQPFQAVAGEEAQFGHGKTVNLIKSGSTFEQIETKVRQILKMNNSWIVDETTKRQTPYWPHVTAQAIGRMYEGDSFACKQLQIVEQLGDQKKVVGTIKLGHG